MLEKNVIPPVNKKQGEIINIYDSSVFVKSENEVYYLMFEDINDQLIEGQIIEFKANFKKVNSKDTFEIFVRSNGATYYGYSEIEILKEPNNLRTKLYKSLFDYDSLYADYTLALLYKTKTNSNNYIFELSTKLGISHLFIISGFHISLFFILLDKMNSKLMINKKLQIFISGSITFSFLWFIFMPFSGIRAFMTSLISRTTKYSNNDALSITALLFFLYNPWLLFSTSLLLSFGIVYGINLILKLNLNKLEKALLICLSAFSISVPIVATWNDTFNLLSPLFTILFSPIISFVYLLLIIFLPFNMFGWIIEFWIWLLNWLLLIFDNFTFSVTFNILTWNETLLLLSITYCFLSIMKYI